MRPDKRRRNQIFEAVQRGGLDPMECTFEFDDAGARITHVPTHAYFLLVNTPGHYTSTAVVGDEGFEWPGENFSWDPMDTRIQRWAGDVKRDAEIPDLWAELQREREVLTSTRYEDVENTPFTPDEQTEIAAQLGMLKEYVRATYVLTADQYATIDRRLESLEGAARRGVGRIDWRNQFVGVIVGLMIDAVLPPDAVRQVLVIALRGLALLFGPDGVPELPGAPPGMV
jgi:hypothetical protein